MPFLVPSQIFELTIISAQGLAPVARYMKTYATAWLDPDHKLTTRVDNTGGTSPTWNDKFVFRLDNEDLYNGILVIEIYALHWFKDIHVGTVQALVLDLISPQSVTRFITLEILRASGRPHGLLNIAVGVIDSSRQSMPLYTPSMFEEDLMFHQNKVSTKPIGLRRSKSETSSMMTESDLSIKRRNSVKNITSSSSDRNEFSSDSQIVVYQSQYKTPKRQSKPALDHKITLPKHMVHGTPMRPRNTGYVPKKNNVEYGTPMRLRRPIVITESELGPSASVVAAQIAKERAMVDNKEVESTVISVNESIEGLETKLGRWQANLPTVLDVGSSYQGSSDYKTNSNPKPTSHYIPNSSYKPNKAAGGAIGGGGRSVKRPMVIVPVKEHNRRRTDSGNSSLFSCFSKICGIECSIVCGGGSSRQANKKK